MKEFARTLVIRVHRLFLEHSFFGPLLFIVLTTSLLLPPFGGVSTDAIKYSCLLLGFAFLGFSLRENWQVLGSTWLSRWLLAWVIWVSFSTLFARDPLFALLGNYPRYNSSWIVYVGFAVLLYAFVSLGQRYARALVVLLALCSFLIAVFGILQSFGVGYYGGLDSLIAVHPDRVPSLVGNPNFSAWYVACALPFAILGLIKSKNLVGVLTWLAVIFASCWSLVLFASRGAILGAAVGIAVLLGIFLVTRYFKLVMFTIIAGLCCVLLFFGYYNVYRTADSVIVNANSSIDASAYDRFVAWDMARVVWQNHKFLGIGPGNFDQYYWELLPSPLMGGAQYFDDAHNAFLVLLVDLGWPGFGLFVILIAGIGLTVFRKLKRNFSLEWWMAGAAGIAVWLVASIFNPVVVALWVLLAVLAALTILPLGFVPSVVRINWFAKFGLRTGAVMCVLLAVGLVVGEYTLVYVISIEPYKHQYAEIMVKQSKLTTWSRQIEPYNLEVNIAKIATDIASGHVEGVSVAIARAFALHPYSARSALLASQASYELWRKTQDEAARKQAEKYLVLALQRSKGYPVVETWAAQYYWQTGNVAMSERYARISAGSQGTYFNWLLLAKQYREKNNLRGMVYALSLAQSLVPDNQEMKTKLKQLKQAQNPKSLDIVPGDFPVLTRLH